ncbi:MAG: fibronectin type III domain-containing protein [Candidatus Omnitrophota bacterium]
MKNLIYPAILLLLISFASAVYADPLLPVRILENPTVRYASIQSAYNAAATGQTIQCRSVTLGENFNLSRDISVGIEGGYNSDFSQKSDTVTTIIGAGNINLGRINLDNIRLAAENPNNKPQTTPQVITIQSLDTKIYISWNDIAGADGYKLKYGTVSGTYSTVEYIESATEYIVRNLTNDIPYYFVVSAYNSYGETANSSELSETPHPRDAIIGYTTVFTSISTDPYFGAVPLVMTEEGTIQSISIYHEAGSGTMILGLYNGQSTPQGLLGVTAETQVNSTSGWQTIDLNEPVHVETGTQIWLASLFSNNPGIRYTYGSPQGYMCMQTYSTLGGAMPETFPASFPVGIIGSIYANYIQNTPPQIGQYSPADKYKCEETETITFEVIDSSDYHYDDLEYQYLVDDEVKQTWTADTTYQWTTNTGDNGIYNIKIKVRDDIGAVNQSSEKELCIFRKPEKP